MAPVSSAFAVYQEKRVRGQKRLANRKRKTKQQQRTLTKVFPASNDNVTGDWESDENSVVVDDTNELKRMKRDAAPDASMDRYSKMGEASQDLRQDVHIIDESAVQSLPTKRKNPNNSQQRRQMSRNNKNPDVMKKKPRNEEMNGVQDSGSSDSNTERESDSDFEGHVIPADGGDVDPEQDPNIHDSIQEGEKLFKWMLHPCKGSRFFTTAWEAKPMHVKREKYPGFYNGLLSTEYINTILKEEHLAYGKNIDITYYANGKRKTLNPSGRATCKEVWDFYNQGCSIRLLNPQAFFPPIQMLLTSLQEYFCSFVGANVYLTPPNSQGFAPHYDDIEAFVLQVEGKKHWKIYKPREGEVLPRESSRDFRPEELDQPCLEVTLNQGELLYFPRGWIHEARTVPGYKSLHITISCYQHQSWIDLFEKLMPAALAMAASDVKFRQGLPVGYLHFMGLAYSDYDTEGRRSFMTNFLNLAKKLVKLFPVDAAIDQFGRQFMHDALPPILDEEEVKNSILGAKLSESVSGKLMIGRKLYKDMKVKITRASVLRLVQEDSSNDKIHLYHSAKNSRVYHELEEHMIELDTVDAIMVEYLLHSYPQYTKISSLPTERVPVAHKVKLATLLFNHGLLFVSK